MFNEYPEVKEKFIKIWKILTKCFNLLTIPNISDECNEELAQELENFTFFSLYTFHNRTSPGRCMFLAWCCPHLLENTKWVTEC